MYATRLGAEVINGGLIDTQQTSTDWIGDLGRIVGIAAGAAVVGKAVFGKGQAPLYPLAPQTPYFPQYPVRSALTPAPISQQAWFWPVVIGGGSLGLLLLTTFMKK